MPLRILTDAERVAADAAANSDLKWLLSDNEVPADVQQVLFHEGFTRMRVFAGFGESRTEVRDALRTDIGLASTDGLESRQKVSLVIAAWEAVREYVSREATRRAEAQASRVPRAITPVEHTSMRAAYETRHGKLRDGETPSVHYVSRAQVRGCGE